MVLEALEQILSFCFQCHCINDGMTIPSSMWHAWAGVHMVKGLGRWNSDGRWWYLVMVPTTLWTFCSPSDLHHFRWQPHLEVNCSLLLVVFFMLEVTSCLALCEMYWPASYPRDDSGFLVLSVGFVILILENNAWRDPLIVLRLLSHWHYSIYLRAVSLQEQVLHRRNSRVKWVGMLPSRKCFEGKWSKRMLTSPWPL